MRTANVKILGEEHLLCLSARAKCDIEDRWGSLQDAFTALASEDRRTSLSTTFALLEIMMRSGATYAEKMGIPTAKPISADDLFDLCGATDLPDLVHALHEAVINGSKREVEAEPPKNSETTPPRK